MCSVSQVRLEQLRQVSCLVGADEIGQPLQPGFRSVASPPLLTDSYKILLQSHRKLRLGLCPSVQELFAKSVQLTGKATESNTENF